MTDIEAITIQDNAQFQPLNKPSEPTHINKKIFAISAFILMSWIVGCFFKILQKNNCIEWCTCSFDCTLFYDHFLAIMMGAFILIIIGMGVYTVLICCSCCIIGVLDTGTPKSIS